MPVSHDVFTKQVDRLLANYRPGEPTDRFGDWLEELFTAFVETKNTSDASVTAAVSECIRHRQTRGLPTVAELRLYVEAAWKDEQREQTKALPPPPGVQQPLQPPPGYSRARWDRNVAIGKARQRNRMALQERITPTETQVDEVLREMATRGQLKGTLDEALAMRVPIDPYVPTPAAVRAPSVAEEAASGPIWPGAHA